MSTAIIVAGSTRSDELSSISRLALDSVDSPRTRRDYDRALTEFLEWYNAERPGPLSKATVQAHVRFLRESGVPASSINQRLAAIRKLAIEAADNGLIDESTAQAIKRVKNIKRRGKKLGNWLSLEEAQAMIDAPDGTTIDGLRDSAVLAIMIGCGLRREEVVRLTVEHLHRRDQRWVILDLTGKHGKTRSVPMADWVKEYVDAWLAAAGIETGLIFRRIFKNKRIGEKMTSQAVWLIVQRYNPAEDRIAPHDLRRTFAVLAEQGGANPRDIQTSLGHESVKTTEVYLGERKGLQNAPSDKIRIKRRNE